MPFYQFQPHPLLRRFVQCYWAIRADSRTPPASDHGVIPGGYIDIVFNVGDQVCLSDSGGVFFDQAGSSVAGPFDRFWRFHTKGRFDLLGVRFHLGRTPFWHSISLKEVRNRAVPLAAILEK